MRKSKVLILVMIAILSLSACGKNEDTTKKTDTQSGTDTSLTDSSTTSADKSSTDTATDTASADKNSTDTAADTASADKSSTDTAADTASADKSSTDAAADTASTDSSSSADDVSGQAETTDTPDEKQAAEARKNLATGLAQKIADGLGVTLASDAFDDAEDYTLFKLTDDRDTDNTLEYRFHVDFDDETGELRGAYSTAEDFWMNNTYVYDADGSIILYADNTKPVSLNPESADRADNGTVLFKGEDLCKSDKIREALLSISDVKDKEDFSDTITIVDGGWYEINLSRNLSRYDDNGCMTTELFYKLEFWPRFHNELWKEAELAYGYVTETELSDGTLARGRYTSATTFPEAETYHEYEFYDAAGKLIGTSKMRWDVYIDGGALNYVELADAEGKELFSYDSASESISGYDMDELKTELGAVDGQFEQDTDVQKIDIKILPIDADHSLRVQLQFYILYNNIDFQITCFMNDWAFIDTPAYGGH